ncbi:ankyrin repeat-containing domain protein [Neocallimastix sp. 'constans']|jgi:ankyrin repeat protein
MLTTRQNLDFENNIISEEERKLISNLKLYLNEKNISFENYLDMSNNTNALYSAIEEFRNDISEYLIEQVENVHEETKNGETILFSAIENNNFYIADILINKKKADINYVNQKQENILIYLIKKKSLNSKSLSYILQYKINLNFQDGYGKTCFIYFIDQKHPEFVKQVIESFIFDNNFIIEGLVSWKNKTKISKDSIENELKKINFGLKDRSGDSALFYAIRKNDFPSFKFIVDHYSGFNPNERSNSGFYLLHVATRYAQEEVVNFLIEHKANVNVYDKFGRTPFFYACQYHQERIVKELLSTNKIRIESYKRDTNVLSFLIYLCQCGNVSLFDFFISKGFSIYFKDFKGSSPLIIAVEYHQINMITYLLDKHINVNERNNEGKSAIMYAMTDRRLNGNMSSDSKYYEEYKKIMELLLNHGANANDKNRSGVSLLMIACNNNQKDIAEMLINHGANIHDTDSFNATSLIFACRYNNVDIIDLLVSKGANVNHQDENGCSPLIHAIREHNINIVKYLIQHGADVNIRDRSSETPLIYACNTKFIDCIRLLLDNGADINAQNYRGESCLIQSISFGYENVVNTLLEYNADVYIVDNNKKTAFNYANERKLSTIEKLLIEKRH